ncbi:hypothetical protein Acor_83670 [Acrocarpospora corrugata]|uniref:SWIM-type domain-containing protein n=1 Tax=Acrocarpospora corrugata TaxID=35763 RepID=A0A5M3WIV6_9ACTN|nr:hypothetical protein [Acrocarpospora corrugata]GES06298.1 hypothetical protein Acor_83670 [Acrocarpospora corrugata]
MAARSLHELAESQLSATTPQARIRGRELEMAGAVQVLRFTPRMVVAEVDDSTTRVEMGVTDEYLWWYCSCVEGRTGAFCGHCVATALAIGRTPR